MKSEERQWSTMKAKDALPKARQQGPPKPARSKRSSSSSEQDWSKAHHVAGIVAGLYLAYLYTGQLKLLHENQLWFSHLTELERDLSFRSESALYYSYYKQLTTAPSLCNGISNLIYKSHHNSVQQFSIFPEIVLASLYRAASLKHFIEPVYFYINAVFFLQGLQLLALFSLAWILSGTSIAGCMAALLVMYNRESATRSHTAVSLRECFAIPFITAGILCTVLYHHSNQVEQKHAKLLSLLLTLIVDVCAAVTWQSAQIIFLLEGICLFAVQTFGLAPQEKVWYLILCKVVAVLTAAVVQPGDHTPLGSMFISFTIAWAMVNFAHSGHHSQMKPSYLWMFRVVPTMGLSLLLNMMFKLLLFGYEDSVLMFRYLSSKLGLALFRDFEVLVCLCHSGFQPMSKSTLLQMFSSGLLPCYMVAIVAFFKPMVTYIWNALCIPSGLRSKGKTPHMAHHVDLVWTYTVLLSLLLGALALWTTRFQYLWVPYVCSVAAAGVCHSKLWKDVTGAAGVTTLVGSWVRLLTIIGIIFAVMLKETPALLSQLRLMKQLHIPDTVVLMQWIDTHTPRSAVFAGSCQILAAISLCTGRATTVGPHLEDDWLPRRAWETYQIYARQDPGAVYEAMRRLGAGYMIVESGLCSPTPTHCSLVGVMDLAGNITGDTFGVATPPRFCEALRSGHSSHQFALVFENHSFAVYKIG